MTILLRFFSCLTCARSFCKGLNPELINQNAAGLGRKGGCDVTVVSHS